MKCPKDYKSNTGVLGDSDAYMKVGSAPIDPIQKSSKGILKVQISAPSYFHSLKENEAPPFRKPDREAQPHLLIGTIITEEDVVEIIASIHENGLKIQLAEILVKKNIVANYNLSEKQYLVNFLMETLDYAAQRDFNASKLACLLTIYLASHLYFKWYYWVSPTEVWNYFKETMIRHTIEGPFIKYIRIQGRGEDVLLMNLKTDQLYFKPSKFVQSIEIQHIREDSPDGQEIFEPEECYDIMTHFHTVYLSNLPLVHILTFNVHRLKILWPFKPK